jgi:hypothetical protein
MSSSSSSSSSSDSSSSESTAATIASARTASLQSRYFSAADSSQWDFGTGSFTLNVWVKRASGQFVWSHGGDRCSGIGAQAGWIWAMSGTGLLYRYSAVDVGSGSGTLLYDRGFSDTGFDNGNWHMATMRRDGNDFQLFVDGSKPTTSYTNSESISAGVDDMYIIRCVDGDVWSGDVAAACIWTRALSDSEITTLYNGGCGLNPRDYSGAFLTSLQNAWPMDETDANADAEDIAGSTDLTPTGAMAGTSGPCP